LNEYVNTRDVAAEDRSEKLEITGVPLIVIVDAALRAISTSLKNVATTKE
jgi:hypothetical protein